MKFWVWCIALSLSAILYWHWGASDQVFVAHQVNKEVQKIKTEIADSGSINVLVERLEKRVNQTPDDPKGWYLLGNLYLSNQQVDQAIDSFSKAHALKPDNVEIMVKYAECLFLKNNRRLDDVAQALIDKVIKQDMQNINALNLIAIDAFQRGDKKKAISYWEKVLIQLPLDSEDAKQIEAMIERAQT